MSQRRREEKAACQFVTHSGFYSTFLSITPPKSSEVSQKGEGRFQTSCFLNKPEEGLACLEFTCSPPARATDNGIPSLYKLPVCNVRCFSLLWGILCACLLIPASQNSLCQHPRELFSRLQTRALLFIIPFLENTLLLPKGYRSEGFHEVQQTVASHDRKS